MAARRGSPFSSGVCPIRSDGPWRAPPTPRDAPSGTIRPTNSREITSAREPAFHAARYQLRRLRQGIHARGSGIPQWVSELRPRVSDGAIRTGRREVLRARPTPGGQEGEGRLQLGSFARVPPPDRPSLRVPCRGRSRTVLTWPGALRETPREPPSTGLDRNSDEARNGRTGRESRFRANRREVAVLSRGDTSFSPTGPA
jgi:hypothetical protein